MRVKRYVVNNVPEALPLIRSELGKDAVILNTKEVYVGGFLGMFRKKKMEVLAAIESGQPAGRPAPRTADPSAASRQSVYGMHAAAAPLTASGARQEHEPRPKAIEEPVLTAVPPARTAVADRPVQVQAAPAAVAATAFEQKSVLDEIHELKALMAKLAKRQDAAEEPEVFGMLRSRLAEQEVSDVWIERLVESMSSHPDYREEDGAAGLWKLASEVLKQWMQESSAEGVSPSSRIVHVVGPTGVGKTTTIAKLAAEQVLKAKRRVGFITSDTYRIAAVDQLRTYANILNVPLEVVFSPLEMARAFKQLEDRELIFMDTAGRNYRNDLFVSEVNSLLQKSEGSETFLVLSLTGKTRDMEAVAVRFLAYGVTKVIYTKMDETDALGPVLNMAMQHGLKTAYLTCGQNVPDDIEPFRPDSYVEQLLGAAPHA